jgi:hypothetical protein
LLQRVFAFVDEERFKMQLFLKPCDKLNFLLFVEDFTYGRALRGLKRKGEALLRLCALCKIALNTQGAVGG